MMLYAIIIPKILLKNFLKTTLFTDNLFLQDLTHNSVIEDFSKTLSNKYIKKLLSKFSLVFPTFFFNTIVSLHGGFDFSSDFCWSFFLSLETLTCPK